MVDICDIPTYCQHLHNIFLLSSFYRNICVAYVLDFRFPEGLSTYHMTHMKSRHVSTYESSTCGFYMRCAYEQTYIHVYLCLSLAIADTDESLLRCCVTCHSLTNFILNRRDKFGFKNADNNSLGKWFELISYFMPTFLYARTKSTYLQNMKIYIFF